MNKNLDLGIIGNSSICALIDKFGKIVWSCYPSFDGDPIFCDLLNDNDSQNGFFEICVKNFSHSEQVYFKNTAILNSKIYDKNENIFEIIDFIPRFERRGRMFKPNSIVRILKPIKGSPRSKIKIRISYNYGSKTPVTTRGSNHIRYLISNSTLRMTTDIPITYVEKEIFFFIDRPLTIVLGPDETLEQSPSKTGDDFFNQTMKYWQNWSRKLSIPFEWQDVVIRSAITLQLSCFEETGAIIAAPTTSIPEAPNSERNWDYRYCWLRDSYFVVKALNSLGVTETMEKYLNYINNIVADNDDDHLQPVFSIYSDKNLEEKEIKSMSGFQNMGPVRIGNNAYLQSQNDGYGSVILASAQSFFDTRLNKLADVKFLKILEDLGEKANLLWDKPDAGIWELRTRKEIHTFSSLMCWVACDRLERICNHLNLVNRAKYWKKNAKKIRKGIFLNAWNSSLNSFVDTFGGSHADASLLLMSEFGFLDPEDPHFLGTLEFVEKQLKRGKHIYRYHRSDDFGVPETSFNVCTFWYIDALVSIGRVGEARDLFENMLKCRNPLGLMSEDFDPVFRKQWGNFPQTYSMVGLIKSAKKLSKSWSDAF